MIHQRENLAWHRANSLLRIGLVKGFGNAFADYCLVNEYPKSGGSWAAQMLSDALEIPFPRNRLPMLQSSILHGHYLADAKLRRRVIVWRDGRDVAVSWFYHMVIGNNKSSKRAVSETRKAMGLAEVDPTEPGKYFSQALEHFLQKPRFPGFTWANFVDRWSADEAAAHVQYEALLENPERELRRLCADLGEDKVSSERIGGIVRKYSFESQASRKPGEESKRDFLRKGIAGDWRNYFSPDDCTKFINAAGQQLIKLGYEKDDGWSLV